MRLVSYYTEDATDDRAKPNPCSPRRPTRLAVQVDSTLVDLPSAWSNAPRRLRGQFSELGPLLTDVKPLLEAGSEALECAKAVCDWALNRAADEAGNALGDIQSVELAAPVLRPGKIICVGLNYMDHILEVGRDAPSAPTLFSKPATTVVGPGARVVRPSMSSELDYEVEMGLVIGRCARNVSEHEARRVIAGLTVLNDLSARDLQHLTNQWYMGKAFDTSCPMGPALVTLDEIPDLHDLTIECSVNGEMRQRSNTRHLLFNADVLVSYISRIMTLEPGDVIATGTPGGVAFGQDEPMWLKPGDHLRCELEAVGVLENSVSAE